MKIAFGADEINETVQMVNAELLKRGYGIEAYLPTEGKKITWINAALAVAKDVSLGVTDEGILLCWTGTGVCMAANKVRGIRAALCGDAETARGARLWNNANVLCMSMRLTTPALAKEILEAWFGTKYIPNPEDDACLQEIDTLDTNIQALLM